MLHLYRRHLKQCNSHSRCQCLIWARGKVNGEKIKKSLDTRNWEAAGRMIREWEETGRQVGKMKIEAALERFIENCKAIGICPEQLKNYERMKEELEREFKGRPIDSIKPDELGEVRERNWKRLNGTTQRGRLGRWHLVM